MEYKKGKKNKERARFNRNNNSTEGGPGRGTQEKQTPAGRDPFKKKERFANK